MGRGNESIFLLGSYTKKNEENGIMLKQGGALGKNSWEK